MSYMYINVATRCVLRAYNAAKCDCGRGSAPDPAGGAYSTPSDPLAGINGDAKFAAGRGKEGKGKAGMERERENREGRRGKRKGGKLEQGRRLAKAGPAFETRPT